MENMLKFFKIYNVCINIGYEKLKNIYLIIEEIRRKVKMVGTGKSK